MSLMGTVSRETSGNATQEEGVMSETQIPVDRLLTVEEAAIRMNVKRRFIRRLIHKRRIDVRHLGKHVRIRESAVEAFIEAGAVPAVPRPRAHRRAV